MVAPSSPVGHLLSAISMKDCIRLHGTPLLIFLWTNCLMKSGRAHIHLFPLLSKELSQTEVQVSPFGHNACQWQPADWQSFPAKGNFVQLLMVSAPY